MKSSHTSWQTNIVNIVKPEKVKHVHNVIPNLKHKLLSSESIIGKLTYQNKKPKTQTFSLQNFWS